MEARKLSVIYDVTALCPWNCAICCMGATSDRSCLRKELTQERKLSVVPMLAELRDNGYDVSVDLSGGELFTDIPSHTELIAKLSARNPKMNPRGLPSPHHRSNVRHN